MGCNTSSMPFNFKGDLVNSLAPGGFENIFQNVFFKLISWIDTLSNSCETALRSMPQNPSDDKSTLVQVMAWCRQAASHYLSQCCPKSLSAYGVTRPQWVNLTLNLGNGWLITPCKIYDASTSPCSNLCKSMLVKGTHGIIRFCGDSLLSVGDATFYLILDKSLFSVPERKYCGSVKYHIIWLLSLNQLKQVKLNQHLRSKNIWANLGLLFFACPLKCRPSIHILGSNMVITLFPDY